MCGVCHVLREIMRCVSSTSRRSRRCRLSISALQLQSTVEARRKHPSVSGLAPQHPSEGLVEQPEDPRSGGLMEQPGEVWV